MQAARAAGLVAAIGGDVLATSEAEAWLDQPLAKRWRRVAEAWWSVQPAELRAASRRTLELQPSDSPWRSRVLESLHWLYPALELSERARMLKSFEGPAGLLGLASAGELTALGRLSLLDPNALDAVVAAAFPPHVRSVYVQPDLSIIAPGPLEPHLERELREFCVMERADLASSLRMSVASVNLALARGISVEAMRGLLERLTGGNLPQPVRYLLEDAASRFGRVRVSETGVMGDATRIRSTDRSLLEAIAADQTLAALGLRVDGDELRARAPAASVLWLLTGERYPAVLEDSSGAVVAAERGTRSETHQSGVDPVAAAWARVRSNAAAEAHPDAFLARQLQQAIRLRSTLAISVALPSGDVKRYRLAPTALVNGRVRGRDVAAEIERTLPLAAIVAVEAG